MRDIKRIDKILKLLGELWKNHPDYRFGQLLINYGIVEDTYPVWSNEDDGFEDFLKELIKNEKTSK